MEATVEQLSFKTAVDRVRRVIPGRTPLPILRQVLLEADEDQGLRLSGTDLGRGLSTPVASVTVVGTGACAVPGRVFKEFVATLPPESVTLKLDGNKLRVTAGQIQAAFPALPADAFPVMPEMGGDVTVDAAAFQAALKRVLFAAATDTSRPVLEGVLLRFDGDALYLAAADGYRMSRTFVRDVKAAEAPRTLIVPAPALALVQELAHDGLLRFGKARGGGWVTIDDYQSVVSSALIDGAYPDIERIIPDHHAVRVVLDTQALRVAVRRALIFARNNADLVVFDIHAGEIVVRGTSDTASGDSTLSADVTGEGLEVAFNGQYIDQFLDAVTTAQIALELNSPTEPAVWREVGGDADFVHVIMPMELEAGR